VFEQNVMNMRILMQHRNRRLPPRSTAEVGAAVIFITLVIVGFAVFVATALIATVIWIAQQRLA
jgi:hypothetical protein